MGNKKDPYSDYALWQRERVKNARIKGQLSYWKERLAGSPAVLELPADRPRPPRQTYRGARHSLVLPESLSESIKALSRKEGCTLFMTLLAAFKTLVHRLTGQNDIVVGTPIAERNRREFDDVIGIMLNTLALRSDLSGKPTFRELLTHVREVTIGAYDHQDIPFEMLIEELHPERDLSRTPLIQVLFNMLNFPIIEFEMTGLKVEPFPVPTLISNFDFTLYAKEENRRIHFDLVYNTDLFDASTIQRFRGHYKTLMEEVIKDADRPIATIPILTDAERQMLGVDWNDTQADYPAACIHTLFEAQAEKTPEAIAAIFEDDQVTCRELNRRANQLAHHLNRLGIQAEDRVAIFMERSLEMIVGLLAVLKAGGAYVPMDPIYPPERVAFMLEDSRANVLLTQSAVAAKLPENRAKVVCLDSDGEKILKESAKNPGTETTPASLAYLIYTSGSTGKPKGVLGCHRATINRFAWMWKTFPFESGEVTCQRAPLNVVAAVWEIFGPMLQGIPVVIIPDPVVKNPFLFVNTLDAHRVTRLVVVPSLLRALLDSVQTLGEKLPNLKYCTSSGEALPVGLAQRFVKSVPHAKLLNLYGPTEMASDVTYFEFPKYDRLPSVPIGRPISNTQTYILDQNLELAPIGVQGELHIGGAGLARGYHLRPDLTAEKFIPHPFDSDPNARLYKTGDLARYLPDGNIEFFGRIDDQVKIRGFRIELGEIESVLEQHEAVKAVATTVHKTFPGENRLIAYIVPEPGSSLSTDDLRRYLARKLPNYMIPARFTIMEALPLNPYGKVDRRALPAPDATRPELEKAYVGPRTGVEEELARIWGDVLNLELVGIYDNFFELGGHSLMATRVMAQVKAYMGVNIPLITIFESPTIAQMAQEILKHKVNQLGAGEMERILNEVENSSE